MLVSCDGHVGMELTALHKFSLVLIDLKLATDDGFDGYATIEHLHRPQPATIVASSYQFWDLEVREKVRFCGDVDCLDKLAIFQRLTRFLD